MKNVGIALFASIVLSACTSLNIFHSDLLSKHYKSDVEFLSSDSLKGRYPGTPEDYVSTDYCRSVFSNAGLKLLFNNGLQEFEVNTGVQISEPTYLKSNSAEAIINKDFIPLSFSANAKVKSEMVFIGYGFDIKTDSLQWNDFIGVETKGKWAVILRGNPETERNKEAFSEQGDMRGKVLRAQDHGFAGVILVSGAETDNSDNLIELLPDRSPTSSAIPVLNATRKFVDVLLLKSGKSVEQLEKELIKTLKSTSFAISEVLDAEVNLKHIKAKTWNVAAIIEGSNPELKNQIIVVGAHRDHLGLGGPDSGSRNPDTLAVHNGADDNASGCAMVLELARNLAFQKSKPSRSILFVAFGAEEMGLLGSKYFVKNLPVSKDNIYAMLNLDMVGRLNMENNLTVAGTGTSNLGDSLAKVALRDSKLNLNLSPGGSGGSDHASFFLEKIPVFFLTTGGHDDYHRPNDDADKINYKGAQKVYSYTSNLISELAELRTKLNFIEQKSTESTGSRGGGRFKVTLGIMPDFSSTENNGVRVDMVKAGGPAEKGGMKKGDIIVAMDGKTVNNIEEYMVRLKSLKSGTSIEVQVKRNDKIEILIIPL